MKINSASDVLNMVNENLEQLPGHIFDVISISKPDNIEEAINLSKIISKLSPLVGNLIEYKMIDFMNSIPVLSKLGNWKRQDPGFPDTIFESKTMPPVGFEIKAWFPLATEMTARFKDSQRLFLEKQINVLIISWLPEFVIYGRPKILGVCNVTGKSVAEARDNHYHNPPHYLVLEPEDTSSRTINLQQTNTNGYVFQASKNELKQAAEFMETFKDFSKKYSFSSEYQKKIHILRDKFTYRLDTNYAKLDRIEHDEIEKFKFRTLNSGFNAKTIKEWSKIITSNDVTLQTESFKRLLRIE